MFKKRPRVERRISRARISAVRDQSISAAVKVDRLQARLAEVRAKLDSGILDAAKLARTQAKKADLELKLQLASQDSIDLQARYNSYIQKNFRLNGGQPDSE